MPDTFDTQREVPPMAHYQGLEKETLVEIGDEVSKLLAKDRFINNAFNVLLATMQTYQVARAALSRRCQELDVSAELEGWMAASVKGHAGTTEFERKHVLDRTQGLVLPFLMAEYQAEQEREHSAIQGAQKASETSRRAIAIPLGFPAGAWHDLDEAGEAMLSRERPMTIMGDPGVVAYFLGSLASIVRANGFKPSILRLVEESRQHNVAYLKSDMEKRYFEVGANRWLDCGTSEKKMAKELTPWTRLMRKRRIDLLLVDNLPLLVGGSAQLSDQQKAGSGLRAVSRWAEKTGCAVVAAVPLPRAEGQKADGMVFPALDNTWSNLDVYSDLVQVGVEERHKDTYKLYGQIHGDITTRVVLESSVDKALIDDWRESEQDS